jgi:uncharacterized protein (TIGR02147 family)
MRSVYQYTDYHLFLSDYYTYIKSIDPKFSYRYICSKTGIKSAGHLALILQGKARISLELAERLATFCRLKKRETAYFLSMVAFGQAKTQEEKRCEFEKMTSFSESAVHQVHADQYRFYEKWYHSAIWAVLDIVEFDGVDFAQLGKMIEPTVTGAQAQSSLKLLEKLGMVERRDNGLIKPLHDVIDSGPRPPAVAVNNFVVAMLERAHEALDTVPVQERSLSWATVSLSEKGYREVLEESRDFRRRVLAIAEQDEAKRVYQVNVQIFPLSKAPENSDVVEAE